MPTQASVYHRNWRAVQSARRVAESRPHDLPLDAECKTCASLPGRHAHVCLATQWLLDEPVCDDCAAGVYHYGRAPKETIGSAGFVRRGAA